jgi:phage shock protein E
MCEAKGRSGWEPGHVGLGAAFLALALLLATVAGCGDPATAPPGLPTGEPVPTAGASVTSAPAAAPTVATATGGPAGAVVPRSEDGYFHINPEQLWAMLRDKDFLLVNTHIPYGYEIAGTDASIPVDKDGHWLRYYPADTKARIVLYCRSGQWSTVAARGLVRAGYENVWHLDGGMVAWHRAGFPLVRP